MSRPFFSVVVPTRNRPDTLAHSLAVLCSLREDYEIVVADNYGTEETRQVVERFVNHARITYSRSDRALPMHENYERALDLAQGRYITYVGDDDALTFDALKIARLVFSRADCDVLYWAPHLYWWPGTPFPWKRNLLYVTLANANVEPADPRLLLEQFYQQQASPYIFEIMPTAYSGFVKRELIDKVRKQIGAYFADPIPDVFSGIANCMTAQSIRKILRPLSVRGLSRHSIGISARNSKNDETWKKDFVDLLPKLPVEPELVDALGLSLANAALRRRASRHFPALSRFPLDIPQVLRGMISELNEDLSTYDEQVCTIRALAAKHGVDQTTLSIPPKRTTEMARLKGLRLAPSVSVHTLIIDGDDAGISNIAQATQLVKAVSPEVT